MLPDWNLNKTLKNGHRMYLHIYTYIFICVCVCVLFVCVCVKQISEITPDLFLLILWTLQHALSQWELVWNILLDNAGQEVLGMDAVMPLPDPPLRMKDCWERCWQKGVAVTHLGWVKPHPDTGI